MDNPSKMNVRIDRSEYSVTIESGLNPPYNDLELSPAQAYDLYRRLEQCKRELYDLATSSYDCSDCGYVHEQGQSCPTFEEE